MHIMNIPNLAFWIHEISQSALAAAVAILGVVILLELHAISRLRRAMDKQLARVFEQLDMLRSQNQQTGAVPAPAVQAPAAPSAPAPLAVAAYSAPMGGGEARLLASLAAARARQGRAATAA
jgi:hypothetical protein